MRSKLHLHSKHVFDNSLLRHGLHAQIIQDRFRQQVTSSSPLKGLMFCLLITQTGWRCCQLKKKKKKKGPGKNYREKRVPLRNPSIPQSPNLTGLSGLNSFKFRRQVLKKKLSIQVVHLVCSSGGNSLKSERRQKVQDELHGSSSHSGRMSG